jgi:hypothetical protein
MWHISDVLQVLQQDVLQVLQVHQLDVAHFTAATPATRLYPANPALHWRRHLELAKENQI